MSQGAPPLPFLLLLQMIEYHIRRGVKAVDLLSKPEVQSLQQR